MANWQILKAAIAESIKNNGNQEITGQVLQNVLNNIVSSVGENATFADVATPSTNPGTPDGIVFYLASDPGVYSNFESIEVNSNELAIIVNTGYNGAWIKKSISVSGLNQVIQYTANKAHLSVGRNLFDKNAVKPGILNNTTGLESDSSVFSVSEYILIEPNTQYTKRNNDTNVGTVFYDADLNLISVATTATFTTPSNAKYLRITTANNSLERQQLEKGAAFTVYNKYTSIYGENSEDYSRQLEIAKSVFKLNKTGKNLLNPKAITPNKYLVDSNDTLESDFTGWSISNYIPIKEGQTFVASSSTGFSQQIYVLYDILLNPIYVSGSLNGASVVISYIEGAAFFRISFRTMDYEKNKCMIELGSVATSYEPFIEDTEVEESIEALNNKINELQNNITDSGDINKYIKGLYIVGANPEKTYRFLQFSYRESDNYRIYRIVDEDNTVVCSVMSNNEAIDNEYYVLKQQNSSGITAFLFVDNYEYYNYENISAIISTSLVLNMSDYIREYFQSDFLERDNTARINKLNPIYIENYTNYSSSNNQLLKSLTQNDLVFSIINKLFPLEIGESLTISEVSLFQCETVYVNETRTIKKKVSLPNASIATITNDTGEKVWVLIRIRAETTLQGRYPQIEYSETAHDYEAYIDNLVSDKSVPVVLPDKMYVTAGEEYNIYYTNIVKANPLTRKLFFVITSIDNTMSQYMRQFRGEPTNSKSGDMSITIRENFNILTKATRHLNIVAKQAKDVTIFALGDSFTDMGQWIQALYNDLVEDGCEVNLIGLKNKQYHNESQTGGTLQNSFLVSRGNAFILGVSNFTTDDMADGYGAATLQDTSGNNYKFDGRKVDELGVGVIRVWADGHNNTPSANGVLTKISGNGSLSQINYTTVTKVDRNPLWNLNTGSIDFSNYMNTYGYSINGKFILAIQFSWNDNLDYDNETSIENVVSNFKTIIDKFHEQYPQGYVIIGIEPMNSLMGGKNYDRILGVQWGRLSFAQKVIEVFQTDDYVGFVFINPGYAFVDLENSFNYEEKVLSQRHPDVKDKNVADPTHCNSAGMFQLGDSYRGIVHYILSL